MDGSGFPHEPGSSRQRQQSQPIEDDEAQDRGTQYLGSGQQRSVDPGLPHQANGLHRQRRKYEISVAGWVPERYGVRHIPHQEQYPQAAHHRRAGHASQFESRGIRAGPEQECQRTLEVYQEHRTAGFTVEDGVRSLIDPRPDRPDLRVSAHLVIGREGRVVQLVPFNKCAWHCGPSLWNGIKGLNSRAIGIELVNAGDVERDGLGQWVKRGRIIPDEDVVELQHPLDYHVHGWQKYPPEQVAATLEVAQLLFPAYNLSDLLGHEDIHPQDRRDPGPAFPMQWLHARLLNLNE